MRLVPNEKEIPWIIGGATCLGVLVFSLIGAKLLLDPPITKTTALATPNIEPTATIIPSRTPTLSPTQAENCQVIQSGGSAFDTWLRKMGAPPVVIFKNAGGLDADGSERIIHIGTDEYLPGYDKVQPGDELCFPTQGSRLKNHQLARGFHPDVKASKRAFNAKSINIYRRV